MAVAQSRASFARASVRLLRPMAVAVVLTNLIGWSRKMRQEPSRIMHECAQFMTVMDSCKIVAIDTHTKYGTWAAGRSWGSST
jgi:hypothetical protein